MDHLFPLGILHYLAGGLLIGLAASLLFVTTGRIGGMSTVFSSTWSYFSSLAFFTQERFLASREWRLVYALGLILGALAFTLALGHGALVQTGVAWWQLAIGGFVAGFGARMSGGCTSEKWLRLFEQLSPIYKWIPGGLVTVQSYPRRWSWSMSRP